MNGEKTSDKKPMKSSVKNSRRIFKANNERSLSATQQPKNLSASWFDKENKLKIILRGEPNEE